MKTRWWIILSALVLAIGLGAVLMTTGPRPPEYQGKPIKYWFGQITKPGGTSEPGSQAILVMGERAVPFLVEKLHARESLWRKAYASVWVKLPTVLRQRLRPPEPIGDIHFKAAGQLSNLGPKAKTAIPDLVAVLKEQDPTSRSAKYYAAQALGRIGSEAKACVADLVTCLKKDPSDEVRAQAAQALGRIGQPARLAVPALIEALKSRHGFTRYFAIESIWEIAPDQVPVAMPALVNTFTNEQSFWPADRDSPSHEGFLLLLRKMGPSAHDAGPLLLSGLASSNVNVSKAAAQALQKIDPEAAAKAGVK
ncbi:MAG: HEAT repeat domain-containing protein [Limisphaerales bacterium]